MLARLDLESGPVIGGTIPGIPAVLVGRSDALAWGLTSSYLDDQDVFIERLDPDDPGRYLTPRGCAAFETREATDRGQGRRAGAPASLRWTRHGPVIPGDNFGAAAITPPGHVAVLAWTGLSAEDRSVGAAIALMRARSIGEARAAARDHLAPSLNVTLADATSVAMQMAGAAPRRQAGHTSQGRIPAPGWLAVNDWQGMRAFEENPWVVDPAERHRRQHQQPDHRRRLPRPPELRLGRHLRGSSAPGGCSATGSTTPATASSKSRPTRSRRRRACSCR